MPPRPLTLALMGLALDAAAANPIALMPSPEPTCTTWLTLLDYGFRGQALQTVKTIYTSTAVAFHTLSCGGCALSTTVSRPIGYGGHGPVVTFTATVTAAEPSTTTSTVCDVRPTPHRQQIPGAPGAIPRRRAEPTTTTNTTNRPPPTTPLDPSPITHGAACTSTMLFNKPFTHGPIDTVYLQTVTSTSHLDCGGCQFLTLSPLAGGHGPKLEYTTTVTATDASTLTTHVCIKTPSVAVGPERTGVELA